MIGGIEAQGAWQINDRLVLRGFYEYMYSSFGPFETNYCCTPEGTTAPTITREIDGRTYSGGTPSNFEGNSLRLQPNHKLSSALTYDVPIPARYGTLDVVGIMSWRDAMYPDEANLEIYEIPAYLRWDMRANWVSPNGRYTVTGWVTNVLDVVQVLSYSPRDGNGVTGPVHGTVSDERRIGLTFNYQM